MGDDKLFEYDDGLPPTWVCIALVITMPLWFPIATVAALAIVTVKGIEL